MEEWTNRIICGDALEKLREMPDNIIDVVLTSPPYYGLRDYGVEGQIGLEEHYEAYLDRLICVFKECQRVLKKTGSLFCIIGDTYSANSSYSPEGRQGYNNDKAGMVKHYNGIPPKSLMLIPHRLMIRMVETGWRIRNDLIWFKMNGLPSSVTDRLKNSHEHIIFAVKSRRYYFNLDAIRRPYSSATFDRLNQRTIYEQKGGLKHQGYTEMFGDNGNANRGIKMVQGMARLFGIGDDSYQGKFSGFGKESEKFGSPRARNERRSLANTGLNNKEPYQGNNPHRTRLQAFRPISPPQGSKNKYANGWDIQAIDGKRKTGYEYEMYGEDKRRSGRTLAHLNKRKIEKTAEFVIEKGSGRNVNLPAEHPLGANPGDVFVCNTHPFPDAHFAVFPQRLVEFILKAACPKGGVVLDPFVGSGTTCMVAKQMSNKYIGIDLSRCYCEMAQKRVAEIDAIQTEFEGI